MLSRAPHAAEQGPGEGIAEMASLPAWANPTMQSAFDEAATEGDLVAEEAQEAARDEVAAEEAAAHDAETDEKTSVPDDEISISDGESEEETVEPAPTGELTLAALSAPNVPWTRRLLLLSASVAINVGLPFINGVFLGFGEIFARAFVAPWIGLAPPLLNYNPYSPSPADVPPLDTIPPGGMRAWAKGVQERSTEKREDPHA